MKRQIWEHKQAAWAYNFRSNCQKSRTRTRTRNDCDCEWDCDSECNWDWHPQSNLISLRCPFQLGFKA